jgi:serine/threonine protein kinase/Tfp pilus assembly protein PilF
MAESFSPEVSPVASHDAVTITLGQMDRSDGTVARSRSWGDFQLLQRLGQGGFGEVYRAWDPVLEREIAVKLLLPRGLDAEQEFLSIVSEARAIARVRHPNIVSVYGVDRRDGRVGFWSDYVRGRTLSAVVEAEGALPEAEVIRIGVALCGALLAVHEAGLLHRDVKASNAMRDENGRVLLMDFGLSQELHLSGAPAGTPKYMAPELRRGGKTTVQSDIYAMGVLLLFLATGRYPLTDEESGWRISPGLERVLRRATETDPAARYASAARLGDGLAGINRPLGLSGGKGLGRAPKLVLWVVAGVMVLGAGAALAPKYRSALRSKVTGTSSPTYNDYLAAEDAMARYDKPGNTERAIALYAKTLERTPDFALAEAGLARAYWRMYVTTSDAKWAREANQASDKAFNTNPNLAAIQMTAGSLHVSGGKFDLGMQELQKAAELDAQSAAVHAALGEAYRQQGRLEQAKKELQTAIDLAPENWRWPYLLGALYLDAGDLALAEQHLHVALSKTPDNAEALYNLGVVYWKEGRLAEAFTTLEQASQINPALDTLMALGSVSAIQGQYGRAVSAYQRAATADPASWRAWSDLAEVSEWSGGPAAEIAKDYRTALGLALEAAKRTPNDPDLISEAGSFYAKLHDEQHALPLLRRALLLAPLNADVLARVGTAYEGMGRRQEALDLIGRALTLGFSIEYARKTPALRDLRRDPRAPQMIRE